MSTTSTTELKSDESNLVVCLRIRPMMEDEIYCGATPVAHKVDDNMVVILDPADDVDDILRQNRSREKQYIFDVVLDATASQEETYHKSCKFLIPSIINGFNATVFAYGATGAGKTHTMLGKDEYPGIMAHSLTDLFEKMSQNQDSNSYNVTMSYLEIYNEMIRDLLNPSSGYLDLREDQSSGLQVAGLSSHDVTNTHEVMDILKEGNKQRTQEPTAANLTSSRSHAVLIISVRQRNRLAGTGLQQQYRVGKLILIDLAGSERAANTQNRGKRMVEGAHINRSLLALGNCINALSDKSGSKYVNYRDSKLTRLLKDALGGNCKTVMIAHISPASFHFEETRNTLTYADRAKSLKTKVRQNVLDMTLHIAQYSSVITDLKEEIKKLKQKLEERSSNRNINTMQAIQAEVFSQKDEQELSRLKKELQDACKSQSDIRHNLVEMNNVQSELSVEITRHQMLLNSFKRIKSLGLELDLSKSGAANFLPFLKEAGGMEKVKVDLKDLEAERMKSEKMKDEMEVLLKKAIKKTSKTEEDLFQFPLSSSQHHQREIVNLLAKVHRLENENMRLLKELSRRLDDSRKRNLIIESHLSNLSLADEIIKRQKSLLKAVPNVEYPTELQKLYTFYTQEVENLRAQKSSILPALPSVEFNSLEDSDKYHISPRSVDDIHNITAPSTADNNNDDKLNNNNVYYGVTGNNHKNNRMLYYENKINNKNNYVNTRSNFFNTRNDHIKKFSIGNDENDSVQSIVADMNNEVKSKPRRYSKAHIGKLTSSRLAYIDNTYNSNNNTYNNNKANLKANKNSSSTKGSSVLSPLPIKGDKRYRYSGSTNSINNNNLFNNNKTVNGRHVNSNNLKGNTNSSSNNISSKSKVVSDSLKKPQKKLTYRRKEAGNAKSTNPAMDMMIQGAKFKTKT